MGTSSRVKVLSLVIPLPLRVGLRNRFGEVVVLLDICLLEVSGKISCRMLSPATTYAAYFVFKMKKRKYYGFNLDPVEAMLGVVGDDCHGKNVCLDPDLDSPSWLHQFLPWAESNQNMSEFEQPNWRSDGLFEIELGEFQTNGKDDEVEVILREDNRCSPKSGLVVVGIDIRPKTSPA
ncbi:putative F-box protein PP2-B8 [Cucumis sativus]|uniref:putative F-box protein PP2-B8 n=1 Tax=Cucumis sativus TaxID=3659 RepID=UPI0012F4C070|nr:putative F-box protein PP2-B8 [Cucumis sativus]